MDEGSVADVDTQELNTPSAQISNGLKDRASKARHPSLYKKQSADHKQWKRDLEDTPVH